MGARWIGATIKPVPRSCGLTGPHGRETGERQRMTDEERKQAVREYLSARGRIAGKAKAAAMTPEARRDLATRAANARWAKQRQEKGEQ